MTRDLKTIAQEVSDFWVRGDIPSGLMSELRIALKTPPMPPVEPPKPETRKQAPNYDREKQIALCEGHMIASTDAYFAARPKIDCLPARDAFENGFSRGWTTYRDRLEHIE